LPDSFRVGTRTVSEPIFLRGASATSRPCTTAASTRDPSRSDSSALCSEIAGLFVGRRMTSTALLHSGASDLTHLVFDLPAAVRSFGHRPLVGTPKERRRRRRCRQPLIVPDRCQVVVVLACPVDVDPAGTAVPGTVERLQTTLWTLHWLPSIAVPVQGYPPAAVARSAMMGAAVPVAFQRPAAAPRAFPGGGRRRPEGGYPRTAPCDRGRGARVAEAARSTEVAEPTGVKPPSA